MNIWKIISLLIVIQFIMATATEPLVLIGGALADENEAIYQQIINFGGGNQKARIGVITAGSDPQDAKANAEYYCNLFRGYGVYDCSWIPIDLDHKENNQDPQVLSLIAQMTAFFFGGGDQERISECFFNSHEDSPALSLIRKLHTEQNVVISGSSAGTTIMQGNYMVTGGESYNAVTQDKPHSYIDDNYPDDLSYDPYPGFNIFTLGLLDTHFSQRGREGRMIRLLDFSRISYGFGIDENTALVINGTKGKVIGEGGVWVFNMKKINEKKDELRASDWEIDNVLGSYLTLDDEYDFTTNSITFASWKSSLYGREIHNHPMTPTDDIFSSPNNSELKDRRNPNEMEIVSCDLFDSKGSDTYGLTYEDDPTYEVDLTKDRDQGADGYQGYFNDINYYAFENLKIDIFRY
ncbi:cyanophycinase [Anaeramoeba ignava]|uniref:Cyanophycinase n=1 Tax=Anaeramoeba ignava TaxID=1746090 RepID=A0A9Q0RE76_ANAIG|nr:cyanophycinase [Anaeramoeba ignava]